MFLTSVESPVIHFITRQLQRYKRETLTFRPLFFNASCVFIGGFKDFLGKASRSSDPNFPDHVVLFNDFIRGAQSFMAHKQNIMRLSHFSKYLEHNADLSASNYKKFSGDIFQPSLTPCVFLVATNTQKLPPSSD